MFLGLVLDVRPLVPRVGQRRTVRPRTPTVCPKLQHFSANILITSRSVHILSEFLDLAAGLDRMFSLVNYYPVFSVKMAIALRFSRPGGENL